MANSASNIQNLTEQYLFEYTELRKEILQNDVHTLQIQGGAVVLSGAIVTLATTDALGTSILPRSILFFVIWLINVIALHQSADRGKSSFLIASYLRQFVEPYLPAVKWESRLACFRENNHRDGYNSILTGQFWFYALLLIGCCGAGSWYAIGEAQDSANTIGVVVGMIILWAAATLYTSREAISGFPRKGNQNIRYFDEMWDKAEQKRVTGKTEEPPDVTGTP